MKNKLLPVPGGREPEDSVGTSYKVEAELSFLGEIPFAPEEQSNRPLNNARRVRIRYR